jgi:hypothetical protein
MGQLVQGTTYSDGMQVTADNLNAHVAGARLTYEAVTAQDAALSVGTSDKVLIAQGSALKYGTVTQVLDNAALPSYVKLDGTRPMTGELTLSSAAPAGTLSAIPKTYVDAAMPTGAIMAFYRSTAPAGWLECNGDTIPITTETAALRALILPATAVPDLRGEFIRGWIHDRTMTGQTGRALANAELDMFASHAHQQAAETFNLVGAAGVLMARGTTGSGGTTNTTGGVETRPRNLTFMYCIKL